MKNALVGPENTYQCHRDLLRLWFGHLDGLYAIKRTFFQVLCRKSMGASKNKEFDYFLGAASCARRTKKLISPIKLISIEKWQNYAHSSP